MVDHKNEIASFIDRQLALWPDVRLRFEQLSGIVCKQLTVNHADIRVQFNPLRVHSTTALVDAVSVEKRPCFLCSENRFPEQIFLSQNGYHVLINPYPILPKHLTIADGRHLPQLIAGRLPDMFAWAKWLEGFLLFYNGAQCGASAPDHFHFQAVEAGHTPLEQWMDHFAAGQSHHDTGFSGLRFFFSGRHEEALCRTFEKIYRNYESSDGKENMMNIFCRYADDVWQVVIIPRRKHRPGCYFDAPQMLISPGALDMAGIVVTARETDFQRISVADMEQIYREVAYF